MTATKANGEDKMKKAKITFERVPHVGKSGDEWTIRANDREAGCLFRDNKTGDWHWLAGFSDDAGYKLSADTHIDLPNGIPVHAAKRLVRDAIQNTGSVVHHTGRFNDRGDEVVVAIITTQEGSGPAVCALTNEDAPRLVHLHRPLIDRFAGEDAERDESERESFITWTIRVADKGLAASYSWISEEGALDRDFVRPTETETCSDCDGDALRLDTTTGAVDCVDCGNETETETETMTRQERAEAAAYDDGVRCRRKGLGITASGLYDFTSWRRLFGRVCLPCPDREAAYDAWADGWYDEDERLSCLAQGVLPCGRPIGEA